MKNKMNVAKLVSLALLSVLLVTFTHCLSNAPKEGSAGGRRPSSSPVDIPAPPQSREQFINQAQVATGIRNHEELLHTFSELTGIGTMTPSVVAVYRDVETSLPTTNDVKKFLPANQVAVTKLAAEFCTLQVDTVNGNRAMVWPDFNFDTTLANFGPSQRLYIIQNMLDAFWGEEIVSPEERSMAEDDLMAMMDMIAEGETLTSTASTRKLIKGACTVALSSAYVIMF